MTVYAYQWRCPRCGATYESPIAVMGVTCGKHKGSGVAMKPDESPQDIHKSTMDSHGCELPFHNTTPGQ